MVSKTSRILGELKQLVSQLSAQEKELLIVALTEKDSIPVSIFSTKLSGLEAISLYLNTEEKKSVKQIATVLNRNKNTIYTSLNAAQRKKVKFPTKSKTNIPLSIFANRKFSILESLVVYLKETKGMTLKAISEMTNKHYSTIKTTHWRYQKKC